MITESLDHAILAKESSQPHSSYEAAASLTEFELKKIFIDKIDKSESYLAAPKHSVCYDRLVKSYDLYKTLFSTYDKVYSLKRNQKDKDPSDGSDQGLKKGKTGKDAEPTKSLKAKESQSGSSKGTQSRSKSSRNSIQLEEPEFEALKTWFQTFGVLLKSPMINMHFEVFLIGEINVMRKHGYGYLKEIVVRRVDNNLFKFKEGDFPRLRINDIEDMLLLVVQNRLTNLSGDDVSDFAIALEKQVMHSDELYKFNDGTLTRFQTLLEVITKNIHMEYLPTRRWSTLEKKRANIMIKNQRDLPMDIPLVSIEVHSEDGNLALANLKQALGSDEGLKLKNIKKDGYTRFEHQEQYEHVGPEVTRSQEGKRPQDDDKRLCLVDDLKEVQDSHTSSSLKSMITTTYSQVKY
uniref:Uncharacterized protein n=1 Tax=Tanacetum cinerariifolium TaxID=118510 RepID=A0A6L2P8L2_TANCI|nr:hypothetical protein [Tanacetum cinerariifolium]